MKVQHKLEPNQHPLIDGVKNHQWINEPQKSHPLVLPIENYSDERDEITLKELTEELESIALDWKSVRSATECPCSTPLDFSSFKVSCECSKKN